MSGFISLFSAILRAIQESWIVRRLLSFASNLSSDTTGSIFIITILTGLLAYLVLTGYFSRFLGNFRTGSIIPIGLSIGDLLMLFPMVLYALTTSLWAVLKGLFVFLVQAVVTVTLVLLLPTAIGFGVGTVLWPILLRHNWSCSDCGFLAWFSGSILMALVFMLGPLVSKLPDARAESSKTAKKTFLQRLVKEFLGDLKKLWMIKLLAWLAELAGMTVVTASLLSGSVQTALSTTNTASANSVTFPPPVGDIYALILIVAFLTWMRQLGIHMANDAIQTKSLARITKLVVGGDTPLPCIKQLESETVGNSESRIYTPDELFVVGWLRDNLVLYFPGDTEAVTPATTLFIAKEKVHLIELQDAQEQHLPGQPYEKKTFSPQKRMLERDKKSKS